jgi:hypothetical protein
MINDMSAEGILCLAIIVSSVRESFSEREARRRGRSDKNFGEGSFWDEMVVLIVFIF